MSVSYCVMKQIMVRSQVIYVIYTFCRLVDTALWKQSVTGNLFQLNANKKD